MGNGVRKILRETLIKVGTNQNKIITEVSQLIKKNLPKIKEEELKKSIDFLMYSKDKTKFLNHIFESAEMFDALLDICVLTFSSENSKLGGNIATFSLPAGWTCPFAHLCLKKVHRDRVMDPEKEGTFRISDKTGEKIPYKGDVKVEKGEDAEFDCYAANMEMQYDAVRANRWHNYDLLQDAGDYKAQADLIIRSLNFFFDSDGPKNEVRIHESGDFYNGEYLKAWIEVAKNFPNIKFYAYTKSIPLIKKNEDAINGVPNLSITLSDGGLRDRDLETTNFKEAKVYNTPEEVLEDGLMVDLDDSLAKESGGKDKNFALLVHGTQVKGKMSQIKLRNETFMAYWKYRQFLNRNLNLDKDRFLTPEEASGLIDRINKMTEEQVKKRKNIKFIKKLLKYVVKYHTKYNFSDELIQILPPKYRP